MAQRAFGHAENRGLPRRVPQFVTRCQRVREACTGNASQACPPEARVQQVRRPKILPTVYQRRGLRVALASFFRRPRKSARFALGAIV